MNPQRAWMLSEVAREETLMPPAVIKKENLPPPASGANRDPVGDASLRAKRDREKTTQSASIPNLATGCVSFSLLPAAKTRAVSLKRSHAEFSKDQDRPPPALPNLKLPEVPSLGPAPKPNPETKYLLSLLKHRELHLVLLKHHENGQVSNKLYKYQISDVCLVQHGTLSKYPCTRILPLSFNDPDISIVDGVIKQSVQGELLEEIWAGLNSQMKRQYARQLRKIVDQMRGIVEPGSRGSVQSGHYMLFLDKHSKHTYYAVRRYNSPRQFTAFLLSSFYKSVPKKVALASATSLKTKGRQILSHCSLCPRNIIVDKGKIAWIIGWDCAGFYPPWWDYVKFFEARTRPENNDWYDYAGEIFSVEYPTQLVAYQGLARCQQL
ncbi:hypothetical protein B0J13DRAFT_666216 [Dactylonectria estremocensis]|uniref:Aminoglycoside phosphotransferase domain-containing protein n=1 Tax=Dactylonectria estremocensis TaxID=1079267 RepID=A0A9P9J3H9_9HYPO|nr:hypothetical protein B0J13DRAFT_666216 [Dactylonectria estremocensis]